MHAPRDQSFEIKPPARAFFPSLSLSRHLSLSLYPRLVVATRNVEQQPSSPPHPWSLCGFRLCRLVVCARN